MKKTNRRYMALAVAIILVLSLAIPVFAAPAKHYDYYVAMGDSIAVKTGTDMSGRFGSFGFYEDSYAERVAEYYGVSGGYLCAGTGWRTQDARVVIDTGYDGDDFTRDLQKQWGGYSLDRLKSLRPAATAALEKADLITINLGSNNLLGTVYGAYLKAFVNATAGTPCEKRAMEIIEQAKLKNSEFEALVFLLDAGKTITQVNILLRTAMQDVYKAVSNFSRDWDDLLASVRKANPDADIAVLGIYNPSISYAGALVGGDAGKIAGTLIAGITQPVIDILNNYMEHGSPYADDYVFVPTMGVDQTNSHDGAHLGYAGHKEFADKLIAAIDANFVCAHEHTAIVNEKKATLFKLGYSGDVVCSDCGMTLQKGKITTYLFG